ncbi:MAG: hypothetical protein ACC608_05050 [Anaerofustis sp.]
MQFNNESVKEFMEDPTSPLDARTTVILIIVMIVFGLACIIWGSYPIISASIILIGFFGYLYFTIMYFAKKEMIDQFRAAFSWEITFSVVLAMISFNLFYWGSVPNIFLLLIFICIPNFNGLLYVLIKFNKLKSPPSKKEKTTITKNVMYSILIIFDTLIMIILRLFGHYIPANQDTMIFAGLILLLSIVINILPSDVFVKIFLLTKEPELANDIKIKKARRRKKVYHRR